MFNECMLVGTASHFDKKYTQNGLAILSFMLETTESYVKDGEQVNRSEHHRVVAFGNRAEIELFAPALVFVSGKIRTRKYNDRDGQERYITEIAANRIVDLSKPQEAEHQQQQQQQSAPAPQPQHYEQRRPQSPRRDEAGWETPPPPTDIDTLPF